MIRIQNFLVLKVRNMQRVLLAFQGRQGVDRASFLLEARGENPFL